jgi:DNA-binding response OmpR family regulator
MPEITMLSLSPKESEGAASNSKITEELTGQGFRVRVCTELREFFTALGGANDQIIILDVLAANDVDEYMLTSMVRATSSAGILLFSGQSSAERMRGLNSGADFCLSVPVETGEVVAALSALHRRLKDLPGKKQAALPAATPVVVNQERIWTLESRRWHLRSPDGVIVMLSSIERTFMTLLFQDLDRVVRRDFWGASDGTPLETAKRQRLGVLVSRLRRKMKEAGVDFPLHAYRGVGYQFSEYCQVREESE